MFPEEAPTLEFIQVATSHTPFYRPQNTVFGYSYLLVPYTCLCQFMTLFYYFNYVMPNDFQKLTWKAKPNDQKSNDIFAYSELGLYSESSSGAETTSASRANQAGTKNVLVTLKVTASLCRNPEIKEPSLSRSPAPPVRAKSLQLCPTLCDPVACSPPGSSVLGVSRQEHRSGLPLPSPVPSVSPY